MQLIFEGDTLYVGCTVWVQLGYRTRERIRRGDDGGVTENTGDGAASYVER